MTTTETIVKHARISGEARAKLAKDLVKKYADGASIRDLATETGRSYGWVHRLLTENDVTLRGRGGAHRNPKTPKH